MLISILLPVYNEGDTIVQSVERIFSVDWPVEFEVIAVDDASSDDSAEKLQSLSERFENLYLYRHNRNEGKGAAIRTAISKARGEVIAIQDADLEYDPAELVKLAEPIFAGVADVVYGSRFLQDFESPRIHKLANKFLTGFSNLVTGLHLTDMETCQKVIRRELLDDIRIRSNRFGIEPEITAKLARKGASFLEMPISYQFRTYREGKKITWWDGIKACFAIIYFRFFD